MHIHNTTFVCSQRDLPVVLGLLRANVIPELLKDGYAASPRLARVASEVPGDGETESISLQFEFESPAAFVKWKRTRLPYVQQLVASQFGDRVLLFTTLLQTLPHE